MSRMASKVMSRAAVAEICATLRASGKKIGFTSGNFDLLHRGHVDYLQQARELCDVLVVGVNSDASVRSYKSSDRPIITHTDRAFVVSSLACVDYVFVFEESKNSENINIIKPHYYIKAGDYSRDRLSSAPLIEEMGGEVRIIPMVAGYSTSSIIERIQGRLLTSWSPMPQGERKPAAFLDRDGTIIEHVEYLHEPEKVKLLPGAAAGIKALRELGYYTIVVTNQPGIGLGYFTKEDFYRVNIAMMKALSAAGAFLDKIYFSPYTKGQGASCRKPATGMIDRACADLPIDLPNSIVIGDMTSDIQLGKNVSCYTMLMNAGKSGSDGNYEVEADFRVDSLLEAAHKARELRGSS